MSEVPPPLTPENPPSVAVQASSSTARQTPIQNPGQHAVQAPMVPGPTPLTPEQLAAIEKARIRGKVIRRAVAIAATDAWLAAVFAVFATLSACMGIEGLIVGMALMIVAFNSFRGLRLLKRYDLRGPKILALNQALLAAIIILYAAYELWGLAHGSSALVAAIAGNTTMGPEYGQFADIEKTAQKWVIIGANLAYIALIVGTVIAQGVMGWYYFSRAKHIRAYLAETPEWVVELQKQHAGK